jgi:DNA-binding Lrp family transcriptional regulator
MDRGVMRAFVALSAEPRRQADIGKQLARFPQIETLHTVSGKFDLIASVKAASSEAMDRLIDELGQIPGVTKIETSVILSTKLDRR